MQHVRKNIMLNHSKINGGLLRNSAADALDQFVIYRSCANPEMIFNQEYQTDIYNREEFERYFNIEEHMRWKFAKRAQGCP